MNIKEMKEYRKQYNLKLIDADDFFKEFGTLDDNTYSDGGSITYPNARFAMQVLEEFTSEK